MSDKVSTIRFRAEGTQDIVSRVEEINRAIQRQQRELANSLKVANQGGPGGADAINLTRQNADHLARLHVMLDQEKKAQFDKETEITDGHVRGIANRENAERAALDKMLALQSQSLDQSAKRQYAAYAKTASADVKADATAAIAAQKANDDYVKQKIAGERVAAASMIVGMESTQSIEKAKAMEEQKRISDAQKANDAYVQQKVAGNRVAAAALIEGIESTAKIEQRKIEEAEALKAAYDKPRLTQAQQANKAATKQLDDERDARAAALRADILGRENAVQSQLKIESGVAGERESQAVQSNKIATKLIDEERNARAAALKADILGREDAIQRQFKIESKAAAEEESRVKRIQKMHVDGAAQQVKDRRADVAGAIRGMEEVERIEKRKLAEANGDGGNGLKGFGAKMILAHAGGMAAGDIIGDQHGGRELGAVIGAMMFGGPLVAAAVGGIELVGSAFRANREYAEASRKATADYTDALEKLSATWTELATSMIQQSPFGANMEKLVVQERGQALKAGNELGKTVTEGIGFGDALFSGIKSASNEFMHGPGLGVRALTGGQDFSTRTAFDVSTDSQMRQMDLANGMENVGREAQKKEYGEYLNDQKFLLAAKQKVYAVSALEPGALKEQALLTAQINLDEEKRFELKRSQTAQAKLAVEQTQAGYALALKQQQNLPEDATTGEQIAAQVAVNDLLKKMKDAEEARKQLGPQQAAEDLAAQAAYQDAQTALDLKHALAIREQTVKTAEANARATTDGYAQTLAVQKIAFAYEEQIAAGHGQAMLDLVKKMHADMLKEETKANRQRIDAATASVSPAAAQRVQALERADLKARGASDEEIRQIETGRYLLQVEQEKINLKSASRKITLQEAEIERALAADLRSSTDKRIHDAIVAAVIAKESAANAEVVMQHEIAAEQAALDIQFERNQLTVAEYELRKAMAADRRAQENPEVAAALRKEMAAKQEAATVKDVMNYRREGMETDLALAVKRHRISAMDADILQMIMKDKRAQERGPDGDRVRKEIIALAEKKQLLRDMEIMNAGEFSSRFTAGQVNFRALNQDHPYSFFRGGRHDAGFSSSFSGKATDMGALNQDSQLNILRATNDNGVILGNIQSLLTTIARNGGLN